MAKSQFKFRLYLLRHLPFGFLAGLRIVHLDHNKALVSIPFGYRNKNPFRSMYFASLSMAAEMAAGIMALAEVMDAKVPVSMLVLTMRAEFLKKAKSKVVFECLEGSKITEAISNSLQTNQGQVVELLSIGTDENGQIVANFWFTWTFKPKQY
jgi:acyl-coenzyme A thioesterase PaaI-like protein